MQLVIQRFVNKEEEKNDDDIQWTQQNLTRLRQFPSLDPRLLKLLVLWIQIIGDSLVTDLISFSSWLDSFGIPMSFLMDGSQPLVALFEPVWVKIVTSPDGFLRDFASLNTISWPSPVLQALGTLCTSEFAQFPVYFLSF